MSSTNRSEARKDHKSDYYITPQYAIRDFLKEFIKCENLKIDTRFLDPCAGGDDENEMSYPKVLNEFGYTDIETLDIRDDSKAEWKGDYTKSNISDDKKYQIIITNPPFNGSIDIIKKALQHVEEYGFVIMLQRLNFMGGTTYKKDFWDEVGLPKYIFVHRKRMSFLKNGQTDSIEYAHYVWQKIPLTKLEFSRIKII